MIETKGKNMPNPKPANIRAQIPAQTYGVWRHKSRYIHTYALLWCCPIRTFSSDFFFFLRSVWVLRRRRTRTPRTSWRRSLPRIPRSLNPNRLCSSPEESPEKPKTQLSQQKNKKKLRTMSYKGAVASAPRELVSFRMSVFFPIPQLYFLKVNLVGFSGERNWRERERVRERERWWVPISSPEEEAPRHLCCICYVILSRILSSTFSLRWLGLLGDGDFCRPTELNLIPIRLDLEFDGRKLKDAFTWNADGANLISSIFLLHHLPFSLSCWSCFHAEEIAFFHFLGVAECPSMLQHSLKCFCLVLKDHGYHYPISLTERCCSFWAISDPDYEIVPFSKRMVKDLNLPAVFQPYIAQAIQVN